MNKIEKRQLIASVEDAGLPRDALYESINGRIIEVSGMGPWGAEIASILNGYLGPYVRRGKLGRLVFDTLFRLQPTIYRRPSIAFVSFESWAKDETAPDSIAWEVIPDLVVNVLYLTNRAEDTLARVRQYFEVGTRAVWLIYPDLETIHIYDSFKRIRVLTKEDTLDGGDVIPRFQLPLALLFTGVPADEDSAGSSAS